MFFSCQQLFQQGQYQQNQFGSQSQRNQIPGGIGLRKSNTNTSELKENLESLWKLT